MAAVGTGGGDGDGSAGHHPVRGGGDGGVIADTAVEDAVDEAFGAGDAAGAIDGLFVGGHDEEGWEVLFVRVAGGVGEH